MFQKHRTERGFVEGFIVPVVIATFIGTASWAVWVSAASYDANAHINDYEAVTRDLHTVVDRLVDVEKSFISLESEFQSTAGTNQVLLEAILTQLTP